MLLPKKALKIKDLKFGHLYIEKTGKVMLYRGRSIYGDYWFYTVDTIYINRVSEIPLFEQVTKNSINITDYILDNNIINENSFECLCTKSKLYLDLGDFSEKFNKWLLFNKFLNKDVPEVLSESDLKKFINVKSGELEVGKLYAKYSKYVGTDLEYITTFLMYMGRTKSNGYVWMIIGYSNEFAYNPIKYIDDILAKEGKYSYTIKVTKGLKRVYKPTVIKNVNVDLDKLNNKSKAYLKKFFV